MSTVLISLSLTVDLQDIAKIIKEIIKGSTDYNNNKKDKKNLCSYLRIYRDSLSLNELAQVSLPELHTWSLES